MSQTYEQLVAAFTELMVRGEKDQWKLAQIVYLASKDHGGIKKFALAVDRSESTISNYKRSYDWKAANPVRVQDLTFADVNVLVHMDEYSGLAVQVLSGITDADGNTKAIATLKTDKERITIVRNFLVENPELVKEALKDDDARSAVAAAAFKAATEGVVAEATGITTKAAKEKAPKRNVSERAVQVEQLKYRASRIGHWAEGNVPSIIRDTVELAEYMTEDELLFVFDQLGTAYDVIGTSRATIRDLIAVKQTV